MDTQSFPRGGIDIISNNSNKTKRNIDDSSDALFGSKRTKRIEVVIPKSSKKGKKKNDNNNDSNSNTNAIVLNVGLGMLKNDVTTKANKIDPMTFGQYKPGCLCLGYVLNVTDKLIVVSLPGGLTGTVPYHEISDVVYRDVTTSSSSSSSSSDNKKGKKMHQNMVSIKSLIQPMQQVRCYILEPIEKAGSDKKKKTLSLSMRSSYINKGLAFKNLLPGFPIYGCITSKEDHGYVISAGMNGVTFFLPHQAIPQSAGEYIIGQPIETVVDTINEGARTVTLRAQQKSVREAVVRGGTLQFNALTVGMMFNATVDKIVQNGIVVKFLISFAGVVDFYSLGRPFADGEWQKTVNIGDTIQARVVYVDHGSKSIRLSARPHVLDVKPPPNLPKLGEILEDLQVISVNKKLGVLSFMNTANDEDNDDAMESEAAADGKKKGKKAILEAARKKRASDSSIIGVLIHKSSLAPIDDTINDEGEVIEYDKIEKHFKTGRVLPQSRVIGHYLMEGWALASNLPSHLSSNIIHWSQVKVGQVLTVKIFSILDFGLVVKIGDRVQATCPAIHVSDIPVSGKLQKKFKIGQKLTVRVWEVKDSSIIVTNKKTVIEDESPLLSIDDAEEGDVVIGVVSKISSGGIDVHFFNSIKGTIPISMLVKQGVLDPEESYRLGQVLRCLVISKGISPNYKGKMKSKAKSVLILGLDIGKKAGMTYLHHLLTSLSSLLLS